MPGHSWVEGNGLIEVLDCLILVFVLRIGVAAINQGKRAIGRCSGSGLQECRAIADDKFGTVLGRLTTGPFVLEILT